MTRTLVRGGALALTLFGVALVGDALGLESLWPVVLAAGVGFAAGGHLWGRFTSFAIGAALGWITFAVRAGFLPDLASARGIALALGIVAVAGVAVASRERLPLWAGATGLAAFMALYEPVYAETPTTFLSDSPTALISILLSAAFAAIAVTIADAVAPTTPSSEPIVIPDEPRTVRIPDTEAVTTEGEVG